MHDSLHKFVDSTHDLAFVVQVTKLSTRDESDTSPACKGDPANTWKGYELSHVIAVPLNRRTRARSRAQSDISRRTWPSTSPASPSRDVGARIGDLNGR